MNISDLFEEHRDGLVRYALSLCRRLDRADDLVQETFLRALTHASLLQGMNPYQQAAWLKRVLRNRFYDEERAQRRTRLLIQTLASEHGRVEEHVDLPDFDALVSRVPLEHEQVFIMRYRLGMTSSEIAREIGLPAGTVRFQLHQCIQCLRSQMLQAVGKE